MSRFTTRVELHHADDDDYDILHAAMEERGFSRFVTNTDGVKYHLPTAEYNIDKDLTLEQVLAKAQAAAKTTGRSHAVVVTKSDGRKWSGLKIV